MRGVCFIPLAPLPVVGKQPGLRKCHTVRAARVGLYREGQVIWALGEGKTQMREGQEEGSLDHGEQLADTWRQQGARRGGQAVAGLACKLISRGPIYDAAQKDESGCRKTPGKCLQRELQRHSQSSPSKMHSVQDGDLGPGRGAPLSKESQAA